MDVCITPKRLLVETMRAVQQAEPGDCELTIKLRFHMEDRLLSLSECVEQVILPAVAAALPHKQPLATRQPFQPVQHPLEQACVAWPDAVGRVVTYYDSIADDSVTRMDMRFWHDE